MPGVGSPYVIDWPVPPVGQSAGWFGWFAKAYEAPAVKAATVTMIRVAISSVFFCCIVFFTYTR